MTHDKQANDGFRGRLRGFLRRFARARRGAVAIQFAAIVLPLAVLSLGLIDVNQASMSKRTLQDALDAATLIVAKSSASNNAQADAIGDAALVAQLATLSANDGTLASSTFTLGGTGNTTVLADASITVTPVVANLWLQGNMNVGAHSEVLRASYDLEVALVLDVTTSMSGTKIADLKTAATSLVGQVVKDSQTPYYSKMSIVPYSNAVNVGSTYAATARGAVPAAKTITGASWASGTAMTITGITKANPAVVTSNGHGFVNGDRVWISGVSGMTQVNSHVYTVAGKTTNTFQLQSTNSSSWSTYSSGGTPRATKCQATNCEVVVTSNGHGFANNAWVYITGVGGMTDLNSNDWQVTNSATNTFWLNGSLGPSYSAFSSNGSAYCTTNGCEYQRFTNNTGGVKIFRISTCVSERSTNPYNDLSPATTLLGTNYPASGNPCLTNTITPLTSTKATLTSAISGLSASGSSGGHIGVAWGWYSISPNFSSIFTGTSLPASYTAPHLKKVLILMTDGEYNSSYCSGVIAQDSTTGSGSTSDHINCNAPNGNTYAQAGLLCTAMKQQGVIIYTVGFQVGSDTNAQTLVNGCATDAQHVYLPATGTALLDAFDAIGADIASLRISK
ncbi:MAG: pilus assembly protein TadG [Caulobacter sp.]|nr:pilus assembly protein TadG [Caulobacter sp.]